MELNVYNWEKFERGKSRYIKFALFILLIVILSILSNNIIWWIFVLIVAWWYIFYTTKSNDTVKMIIWKNALQIKKLFFLALDLHYAIILLR